MSTTTTTRLGLIKPTAGTGEPVNVTTQLGANWDKIDSVIGATICTSGTRPSSPFNGQVIKETDTGRAYMSNGTVPASASWVQIPLFGVASLHGATGTSAPLRMDGTSGRARSSRVTGDSQDRWTVDFDGKTQWGDGSSTPDTNLYRSAANTLKTDDSLAVVGDLTVSGAGQRQFIRISGANETRSSNSFLDSALTLPVVANATYTGECVLFMSSAANAAGDAQFRFGFPSAATISWGPQGLNNALASGSSADYESQAFVNTTTSPTTATPVGLSTITNLVVLKFSLFTAGNAGSLTLQWAQQNTNANLSTMALRSHMVMTREA